MSSFDTLFGRHQWKPIRHCPGRFVLAGPDEGCAVSLLAGDAPVERFQTSAARDRVLVVRFADGGGLISYQRDDGSLLHTLNTAEGFARKLAQLGIDALKAPA